MTDVDVPEMKRQLTEAVRTLFRAENGPGGGDAGDYLVAPDDTAEGIRRVADGILALDYVPIVRGAGQVDGGREDTLQKIAAGSRLFVRHVARAAIEVDLFLDNHVAIVRSLLPATDSRQPPAVEASYRNTHVFVRAGAEWRCITWHVTKVQ